MAATQISAATTTELLKDGIAVGGTVIQKGFKLTDEVIAQVDIVNMDELGEWYEDDFSTLLASLKGQKVKVSVAPFKKLELALEMIQTWKSCKIPLQINFFTPVRMDVWKKHSWLRKQLKDKCREVKEIPIPRMDKKMPLVEWLHRFSFGLSVTRLFRLIPQMVNLSLTWLRTSVI